MTAAPSNRKASIVRKSNFHCGVLGRTSWRMPPAPLAKSRKRLHHSHIELMLSDAHARFLPTSMGVGSSREDWHAMHTSSPGAAMVSGVTFPRMRRDTLPAPRPDSLFTTTMSPETANGGRWLEAMPPTIWAGESAKTALYARAGATLAHTPMPVS